MTALSARGKAELRPPDLSVFSANSAEMEPLICAGCLLLLTLGSAVPGSVAAAAVERAVRPGDSVTLPCDVRHRLETLWFLQRSETLSLGKSASMISGPSGLTITGGLNPRLSAVWDPSSHSISLRIDNITEPDLALYYCADKEGATTRIGSGTRLVYEGNSNASSPTPRTNMTPSPAAPSPAPPRCLLPLWVTPVSAVLSALLASSCVYGLVRRAAIQTGSRDSGDAEKRGQQSGRGERGVQEEDGGLNYATLDIRKDSKRKRPEVLNKHTCTYSEINHGTTP